MLTRFRRHRENCPHKSKGRRYTRCRCPIWTDGYARGKRILKSLKTTDWQDAGRKIQRMEDPDAVKTKPVDEAVDNFLEHCRDLACISHQVSRRSAREGRQYEARAAWRAEAYLNSTVSTASKCNERNGAPIVCFGRQLVRNAG